MKRCAVTMAAGLAVLALCGVAQALDRDASMIDSVGVKMTPFDDNDGLSGYILGEQAVRNTGGDWAFLLGGQYGSVSPHFIDEDEFWNVTAGLKWYVRPPTSLALTFTYGQYDTDGDPDYREAAIELKHRFLPADAPLSPFVTLGGNVHSSEDVYEDRGRVSILHEETSSDVSASAGLGVDVSMTEDMAIVLEGAYTESEDLDDGWVMGVAMKYYWR